MNSARTTTRQVPTTHSPLIANSRMANTAMSGPAAPQDDDLEFERGNGQTPLRCLWVSLHPVQQALVRFVYRYESTGLTYQSIASRFELPTLPGYRSSEPSSGGRPISDKTVGKHCERLLEIGVLTRHGERGPIQLSALGHDLRVVGEAKRSG